jgi:DNA-binding transcriptional ArsR family regulator
VSLSTTFSALSDPTRRAVVERLSRGEATIGELAEPHDMSLPAFTKHIGVLVDAGVVTRRKVGRTVICSLASDSLDEAAAWITDRTAFWNVTLDRLERLVTEENP